MATALNYIVRYENINKTIKIGAFVHPPHINECFLNLSSKICRAGMDFEFIDEILVNILHLKVVWSEYGTYENLVNDLKNGVIDMIGNALCYENYDSHPTFYKTRPVYYNKFGFIIKTQTPTFDYTNLASAFTMNLWITIVCITLFLYCMCNKIHENYKYSKLVTRFIKMFWFMNLLLILEFYGNLISVQLITNLNGDNNFTDIADFGEKLTRKLWRLVVQERYVNDLYKYFYERRNESWTENFIKSFHINPPVLSKTWPETIFFIQNNRDAIGLGASPAYAKYTSFPCGFELKTFPEYYPFMVPCTYFHTLESLRVVLDHIFVHDSIAQLYYHIWDKYHKHHKEECFNKDRNDLISLSVSDLKSCFFLWVVGLVFASAAYSWTLMISRRKRKYIVNASAKYSFDSPAITFFQRSDDL